MDRSVAYKRAFARGELGRRPVRGQGSNDGDYEMAISRVLTRGQVTLPSEVRRKAGIKPGDVVHIQVLGKGRLQVSVLPDLSPRELRERYPVHVPIDEVVDRPSWEEAAAVDAFGKKDV